MAKISVYLTDDLNADMKLLAKHEAIKITELANRALRLYIESKTEELDFAKKQEHEREEFNQARSMQNQGDIV